MSENLETTGIQERPTFLTVLCILTFIGSGLGLLGGILTITGSDFLAWLGIEGSMTANIIALVAAGLCLYGAVKMWSLFKQGFMLYVAGSALAIIGHIITAVTYEPEKAADAMTNIADSVGEDNPFTDALREASAQTAEQGSSGAWGGVAFWIVLIIAFVLMYNANKKHLVH